MQFQAICSKWNKKLTLSLQAQNIDEARSILHKQGYSIIDIKESINAWEIEQWNFFYFDISINWWVQSGKIQSDDIFKAYRKLVEDLKYDVVYIYTSPEMPEAEKKLITAKVRDGYKMYLESIWEKVPDAKKDASSDSLLEGFSPQLLKEIEKYTKIVDETITKIQNILIQNHQTITPEQKSLLERIEMELVQIKGTRNIGKIQSTLEDALKHIGAVELEILKKWMVQEKSKFLAETNALLKDIWSTNKVQTEEEKKASVEYQVQSLFGKIFSKAQSSVPRKQANKVDTNSFIYFKNKRELDVYKKALKNNTQAITRAIFSLKFSDLKRLFLKRKLLKQNITIIDNRINNRNISYTKIVHGVDYYLEVFFNFINFISSLLTLSLFFYSIAYLLLNALNSLGIIRVEMTGKPILFLVIFAVFTTLLSYVRWWKSLIFAIIAFMSIVSFLSINF